MASLFDTYGIKEVADVTFYEINDDGSRGKPVLYLDSLKVSTLEQTAETVDARGGKGNPKLISWNFNKEVNLTLEDALFSPKSMAMMFGDGATISTASAAIDKTSKVVVSTTSVYPSVYFYTALGVLSSVPAASCTYYTDTGSAITASTQLAVGDVLLATWAQNTAATGYRKIIINPLTFPGSYYIVGDTYTRNQATDNDEFFQFIIPKAKLTADNNITMQAEGDPSTFNLNLSVMKPKVGNMIELIQYALPSA